MDPGALEQLVRNVILTEFARRGSFYVPVAVSARHVHLSRRDFETLFGQNASMTRYKNLSQPGQFACEQTVEVSGPRGSFKKVRVLGPERADTQVEISASDSFTLGIKPEIRMSGNITGTPGCTLTGPRGKVLLSRGVIIAARHIHMSEAQAAAYGVKDGDALGIKTPAPREGLMGNVVIRCGQGHDLEVHLDTDEANGNGILCGTILEAVLGRRTAAAAGTGAAGVPVSALDLVTERDVNNALLRGQREIFCSPRGFISPAAKDRARERGLAIIRIQS